MTRWTALYISLNTSSVPDIFFKQRPIQPADPDSAVSGHCHGQGVQLGDVGNEVVSLLHQFHYTISRRFLDNSQRLLCRPKS